MSQKEDWLAKARARAAKGKNKGNRPSIFDVESTIESYRPMSDEPPQDQGIATPNAPELAVLNDLAPLGKDIHIVESEEQDQSPENLGSNQPQVESTSGQINPRFTELHAEAAIIGPDEETQNLGSKQPEVKTTLGQIDLRSDQPQVKNIETKKEPAILEKSKPRVKSTSGQIDSRLISYSGSDNGSYAQIPDEMNEALFELNKREATVMRFLLRYSLNFKRCFVEASAGYIADGTGLKDPSNVRKALKSLVEGGMIVLEKEGNSAGLQPPIWRIPWVESYLKSKGIDIFNNAPARLTRYSSRNLGSNQPQVESTSGQINPSLGSNRPEPRVKLTPASGQIDPQELQSELQSESKKNLLLPENLPFKIRQHLESCSGKHREDEEASLWELLEQKGRTLEEISFAFGKALVLKMKGEGISFPLKFIAKNDFMFYGFKAKPVDQNSSTQPAISEETEVVEIDFQQAEELFKKLSLAEQEQRVQQYHKANASHDMATKCAIISFAQEQITDF